jgi:hypothetical protein
VGGLDVEIHDDLVPGPVGNSVRAARGEACAVLVGLVCECRPRDDLLLITAMR